MFALASVEHFNMDKLRFIKILRYLYIAKVRRYDSNKRKPDSCSALNSTLKMICRIQRGHRKFLFISHIQKISNVEKNSY